jgi:K+-transporting ATPase ATPase C chain
MVKDIRATVVAIVLLTAVLGLGYPALVTGIGQGAFAHEANGSLITVNGKVVGSSLAAQAFAKPQYFHERPSATTPPYNPSATTFSNFGPTNPALAKAIADNAAAVLKLEGPYNPGLAIGDVPVDAVTASASGIDPDISPAYAQLQAARVAAVRQLPLDSVLALVRAHTDGRGLGFLGEPGVNVLELNLALDRTAR